jgi:hypothetical protein
MPSPTTFDPSQYFNRNLFNPGYYDYYNPTDLTKNLFSTIYKRQNPNEFSLPGIPSGPNQNTLDFYNPMFAGLVSQANQFQSGRSFTSNDLQTDPEYLKSLAQFGFQSSDIQPIIDALASAGVDLSGTGFSATPPPPPPPPPPSAQPSMVIPPPVTPTSPPPPVVPTPTVPQGPDTGGNLPFTPNTPVASPSLPFPTENTAVTKDPNQQAIVNQQQMQANLINQIMQQIPGLISQQQTAQQGITDKALADSSANITQQQSALVDLLNQRRQQALQQITTGPEGEAFREKYNNLGLLNSGAFNTGLSNIFGNLAAQGQQDVTGLGLQGLMDQQGIIGQGYGTQSNLGLGGLNRLFGLQDTGTSTINDLGTSALSRLFGNQDFGSQLALAQSINDQRLRQQQETGIGGLFGGIGGAVIGNMLFPGIGGLVGGGLLGDTLGQGLGSLF